MVLQGRALLYKPPAFLSFLLIREDEQRRRAERKRAETDRQWREKTQEASHRLTACYKIPSIMSLIRRVWHWHTLFLETLILFVFVPEWCGVSLPGSARVAAEVGSHNP